MNSRYNKLATVAYERVAGNATEFDISDVIDEIVRELSTEAASTELIAEFARRLAERADDNAAKRAESGQMNLLTGEAEALDAVWRIGDGRRVRARDATREQVLAWLQIRGDNAARVMDAYNRDRAVVAELLAYMRDERTTVEQAVTARTKAKPPLA